MGENDLTERVEGELLDLEYRAQRRLWEASFSRLVVYVHRYGNARVPEYYHDDKGYPVGPWVVQQRVDHIRGKLEPDREHRLQDLPGWTWNASPT